jgi:hypothetical protein
MKLFAVLVMALSSAIAMGQTLEREPNVDSGYELQTTPNVHPGHFDAGEFRVECDCQSPCHECLWCSEHLFGDWLGARSGLAEHGIIADLYQTQFYQGVASGGREQTFKYGGKLDYEFTFEGEKLGLNRGFFAFMIRRRCKCSGRSPGISQHGHALSLPRSATHLDFRAVRFTNTQ